MCNLHKTCKSNEINLQISRNGNKMSIVQRRAQHVVMLLCLMLCTTLSVELRKEGTCFSYDV